MNLSQVKCFIMAAKELNFTKAAEQLYTTQPTVSKYICNLEKELGLNLFDRSGKSLKLTYSGKILLSEFEKILENIDKTVLKAKELSTGRMGRLNIGFPTSMKVTNLLPGLFREFSKEYPDISVEMFAFDFKSLNRHFINGKLDIILTRSFEKFPQNCLAINRLPISRSKPQLYFNHQMLGLDSNPSIEDLKNTPLILIETDEPVTDHEFVINIARKYGLCTSKIVPVNSIETMFYYIESGEGIAILGSSYQITKSEFISCIELNNVDSEVGTDIYWKEDVQNPSINIFADYVSMYISTI
ncbi:DNA-binding transcriptional regulator, LysR family [Anaerovirgula multivorans]|uniref:DNA-binding transcriptional regulator, LysR family n=1 Tax=Anaerovirgula multivorans TaxID=312168 RepID=A0A239K3U2_9FIRM|nr:LysR family transcriptional regulator [Anaerovirgula multivorans]SNT12342.1 DNA-binding transcriptional regulator, LysR family [Anaerovirgula multivorans]